MVPACLNFLTGLRQRRGNIEKEMYIARNIWSFSFFLFALWLLSMHHTFGSDKIMTFSFFFFFSMSLEVSAFHLHDIIPFLSLS